MWAWLFYVPLNREDAGIRKADEILSQTVEAVPVSRYTKLEKSQRLCHLLYSNKILHCYLDKISPLRGSLFHQTRTHSPSRRNFRNNLLTKRNQARCIRHI